MPDSHKFVHYHWIRVYINHARAEIACVGIRYSLFQKQKENHLQGFSLASAIGHSPKTVPDVREFAVQFGQFVRDDFQKCILYGNAQ